jgi:hypothetical protein
MVLLYGGGNVRRVVKEADFGQWLDLDRLLVQLWESRSICPKVEWVMRQVPYMRECVGCLMPEITERGIVDLVECTL